MASTRTCAGPTCKKVIKQPHINQRYCSLECKNNARYTNISANRKTKIGRPPCTPIGGDDGSLRYCARAGCDNRLINATKLRKYCCMKCKDKSLNRASYLRKMNLPENTPPRKLFSAEAKANREATERALGTVLLKMLADQPISNRDREHVRRLGHMLMDRGIKQDDD